MRTLIALMVLPAAVSAALGAGLTPVQEVQLRAKQESERKIARLRGTVRTDPITGRISGGYTPEKVEACLAALHASEREVQATALELLRSLVRDEGIPKNVLQEKIRPATEKILAEYQSTETTTASVLFGLAREIRWYIEAASLDEKARLNLLKRTLELNNSAYNEKLAAVDLLGEVPTAEAAGILKAQLKRVGPKDHLERAMTQAVEKIRLKRAMKSGSPSVSAAILADKIFGKKRKDSGEAPFVAWCIRQLEIAGTPEADQVLQRALDEESLGSMARYEAQEALIRRGKMKPGDRKVQFVH